MRNLLAFLAFLAAAATPAALAHQSDRQLQEQIGFDQHIGRTLPGALVFTDAKGREVDLAAAVGERPTLLVMAWYSCGMLCPITLRNLSTTLAKLDFAPGRDFNLVTVGIDPRDGLAEARKMRNTMLAQYGKADPPGWRVLSGDAQTIRRLAETVGFRYAYDAENDSYAHPAGIVVIRPDGTIARYLFGIDKAPRDLKFALMEASRGKLGTVADRIALRCHSFDPERGEYTFAVMNALRIAGGGTVALLLGAWGWWLLRARRGKGRGP